MTGIAQPVEASKSGSEVNGLSGASKFLIESALRLGAETPALINVSAWSAEFAKLGDVEQNDIFKFLLDMEDRTGEKLSRYHVYKSGEFNWAECFRYGHFALLG